MYMVFGYLKKTKKTLQLTIETLYYICASSDAVSETAKFQKFTHEVNVYPQKIY